MEGKELRDKLSSIKPYTFYGNNPPRRLSADPSKILQPLMGKPAADYPRNSRATLEWAEKTHFKKGGLAGYKLDRYMPVPPKRPRNAYKLFFEETKEKLLAKGGKFTRDEIQAVTPTIKQMWLDASAETLTNFQSLAKKEMERYEKEMREYEHRYPECARQLKIKRHQRKSRLRRAKQLKKGKTESLQSAVSKPRRKSTSATNKVSAWLDELDDSDLTARVETGPTLSMDCESEDGTSEDSEEDDDNGYHGAYRLP